MQTLQHHCFPAVSRLVCTLTSPKALSAGLRQENDLHKHLRSLDQYKVRGHTAPLLQCAYDEVVISGGDVL